MLRDIRFESHCEHHMAPIIGRVHIGYLPRNRVVGISKLARLVEVFARRLQIQEKMTAEIASCLDTVLKPHGVAVVTEATHQCMTTRGVHKPGVTMVTSRMLGVFRDTPRPGTNSCRRSACAAPAAWSTDPGEADASSLGATPNAPCAVFVGTRYRRVGGRRFPRACATPPV